MAFYFSKKKKRFAGYREQFEKNVFCYYLNVHLYGSLSGQGTDDKKPKISRRKSKIISFEASKYEKKVKF